MVLKPPLLPTWLPGLSIARPPSNYPVQFHTIRWGFLSPQGVTFPNTPVSGALSLLCEIPFHTLRIGFAFSSNKYQRPQSIGNTSKSRSIVSRAAPVHPNTCTAQSFETSAALVDPAHLLRALAAAMEQMTQTGKSE